MFFHEDDLEAFVVDPDFDDEFDPTLRLEFRSRGIPRFFDEADAVHFHERDGTMTADMVFGVEKTIGRDE